MRVMVCVAGLLLSGWAHAGTVQYQRGDFAFSVGDEPAYVQRHELPAQWDAAAPGAKDAPWRTWLYDRQVDRRAGHDQRYVEYAFEAKSPGLLGEAGRYELEFNPAYQQLTIHRVELRRDGVWHNRLEPDRISLARRESDFDNDMTDGEVAALIVLDDIRVDDVVRLAYTVTGSNPVLAGQFMEGVVLGWRNPMLDSHLRVLAEPGTQFAVHRENGVPEPVPSEADGAAQVAFDQHGTAAVVDEGNYPVWYQPYPLVQVSTRRDWADVVAWALPLYPRPAALPDDLKARIRAWSALRSPRDRLTAALRAVQDEVRYFGVEMGENTHRPAPPADTWERRRGDCKDKAYLLTAILERLGIESAPALTSIDRGRATADAPPSAAAFDHVIVRAVIDGRPVWVDPTLRQTGGAAGSTDLSRYGMALPVAAGSVALEAIPQPAKASTDVEVTERLAPADGGKTLLAVTSVYRGAAADRSRSTFASERMGDLSRRYADFYRKRYGELAVEAEPTIADDREANVFTVKERYLLSAAFEEDDASIRALEVYADAVATPAELPASMSHAGPLHVATPGAYRHRISVQVPKDWRPLFAEESEHYGTDAFDFRRELKLGAEGATLEHDLVVRQYDVDAALATAQIREMRKVNEGLSSRLRYATPTRLDEAERQRRLKNLLQQAMGQGDGR